MAERKFCDGTGVCQRAIELARQIDVGIFKGADGSAKLNLILVGSPPLMKMRF